MSDTNVSESYCMARVCGEGCSVLVTDNDEIHS